MTDDSRTTTETVRETARTAADRARNLYRKGTARDVIFRRASGEKLFEINLSLAVIAGIAMFLFAGWLLLLTVAAGFLMKIRVEVIHEIDDNTTIQIKEES